MVDIMKNNIILTVCVAVAMTFSLPSQAQRLIPKQRGLEVVGSISQQLPHAQKVASLPAAPCAEQGSADRTGRIHKVK